eukprot:6230716-Amphidinium_carterae.2
MDKAREDRDLEHTRTGRLAISERARQSVRRGVVSTQSTANTTSGAEVACLTVILLKCRETDVFGMDPTRPLRTWMSLSPCMS